MTLFDQISAVQPVTDPAAVGLPTHMGGWGVVLCTEASGRTYTVAVEPEYAAGLKDAQAYLKGTLNIPEHAARFVSLGHPSEWMGSPVWAPVYPLGTIAPRATENGE